MNNQTKSGPDKQFEKHLVKDSIKQEFDITFNDRVERYLEVKPHGFLPNTHFARASSECSKLYRDGHFIGCISLVQAVTESLVKYMCTCNGWKPKKDFEENIETLLKRTKVTKELNSTFQEIWKNRNDFHHLNPIVENDYQTLLQIAREKMQLLNSVEATVFACTFNEGKIVPVNLIYWQRFMNSGKVEVFLRLD